MDITMQKWLNIRCAKLLEEINNTPYTDDSDEIKLRLIMAAMRESSVEMFHRAAENSRKEINKINNMVLQNSVMDVQSVMTESGEEIMLTKETSDKPEPDKQEPKIKLSSSLIRRVDSF